MTETASLARSGERLSGQPLADERRRVAEQRDGL